MTNPQEALERALQAAREAAIYWVHMCNSYDCECGACDGAMESVKQPIDRLVAVARAVGVYDGHSSGCEACLRDEPRCSVGRIYFAAISEVS